MKVTMVTCDWKEAVPMRELRAACRDVGQGEAYYFDQDECDEHVYFVCSEPLDQVQMTLLWNAGDLYTTDDVWEGTVGEICEKLEKYADEAHEDEPKTEEGSNQ